MYEIYKSQALNIHSLSDNEKASFNEFFTPVDPELNTKNMQKTQFTPYSENNWFISSPSLNRLAEDYQQFQRESTMVNESKIKFTSTWSFKRNQPQEAQTTEGTITKQMGLSEFQPFIDLILHHGSNSEESEESSNSAQIKVDGLFPRLLKLSSSTST